MTRLELAARQTLRILTDEDGRLIREALAVEDHPGLPHNAILEIAAIWRARGGADNVRCAEELELFAAGVLGIM